MRFMDFITIFGIAIGLAMDAFAVSIASGVTLQRFHVRYATRVALFLVDPKPLCLLWDGLPD